MRISAVHHVIAGVIQSCKWLASIVGVEEVVGKDGTKIDVEVNAEEGENQQELKLAEPLLWESEFPPEAEKKGMMKEMNSMKDFDVYDEDFMSRLSEEVLLKETGQPVPGPEHTFLGRRLRHNGDSIDVCVSQTYIDSILDLYGMKNAKQVATTGSVTIAKTVSDTPLSPEEHSVYRTAVGKLLWLALIRGDIAYATKELSRDVTAPTAVGKLLWLALIRGDIAYATKELSRDVTAPTMQSVAKLKQLLRYLIGTKMCVLRLRPSYQLSDGNCSLDVNVYVDSDWAADWAGCSKTRKSTSGSTVNILGCNMVSTARTQGTLALSSGEAELYAIGQGVSEALFLRSTLLEAKLAKKVNVNVIAHTDSTAGKSMATLERQQSTWK
eukprot:s572_g5.t1